MVVLRVNGRWFEANFVPVGIQFFCQQHRQSSVDALSHLGMIHDHRDPVIGPDSHERIRHKAAGGTLLRERLFRSGRNVHTDKKAPARGQGELQELATFQFGSTHLVPPFDIVAAAL